MPFVVDSFTESPDDQWLESHVGETGATWSVGVGGSGTEQTYVEAATDRLFFFGFGVHYASGTPATAEYEVEANFRTQATIDGHAWVLARMSTGAETWYQAGYDHTTAEWMIRKRVAGTATTLGTPYAASLSADTTYNVRFECLDATKKLFVDDVERVSTTDNAITAAGRVGVRGTGSLLILDFSATDAGGGGGGGLTAGVASFVSSGAPGIVVTATAPTGGTSPYTYQWQRSTTSGSGFSNISNGGGVSGATTLTLTDDSAALSTVYYYRLAQTDDVAATVNSNQVAAQVYEGGAIGGGSGGGSLFRGRVIG